DGLLALGYFTRAYDRMKLDRDDPATDDLEKGLACLGRLGVENELTLWAHAYVDQKRGRYDVAARDLDRVAESPYLNDKPTGDIRTAAADVRKHAGKPGWFHQERTMLALLRAVFARAGGVKGISEIVLGPERTKRLLAPFEALTSARTKLVEEAEKQK